MKRGKSSSVVLGFVAMLHSVASARADPCNAAAMEAIVARVEQVPQIAAAIPATDHIAVAASSSRQAGTLVLGVRERDLKRLIQIAGTEAAGSSEGFDRGGGLAISQRLAQTLDARHNDSISLLTTGRRTALSVTPRRRAFEIKAVLQTAPSGLDVFMAQDDAETFFEAGLPSLLVPFCTGISQDYAELKRNVHEAAGCEIAVRLIPSKWRCDVGSSRRAYGAGGALYWIGLGAAVPTRR